MKQTSITHPHTTHKFRFRRRLRRSAGRPRQKSIICQFPRHFEWQLKRTYTYRDTQTRPTILSPNKPAGDVDVVDVMADDGGGDQIDLCIARTCRVALDTTETHLCSMFSTSSADDGDDDGDDMVMVMRSECNHFEACDMEHLPGVPAA